MRYNVHPPHAFRNRIAKSIGVLVAAALIATLGLPSASQAQTIGADRQILTDGAGFKVNVDRWLHALDDSADEASRHFKLDRDVHQARTARKSW